MTGKYQRKKQKNLGGKDGNPNKNSFLKQTMI